MKRSLSPLTPALALSLCVALGACSRGPSPSDAPSASASARPSASPLASAAPPGPKPTDLPAPPDVKDPPADAARTPSGLASKVLQPGTGQEHPTPDDKVKVNYTGWTTDGRMFDSSVTLVPATGETTASPTTFGVGQVIKGWTEGLQLMVKGEKRRLWIPAALAYGDHPRRGAPGGDLTFDVELVDIVVMPKPPAAPPDVAAAPASAKKTKSGLAYRLLASTKGTLAPTENDRVMVHYTGWTADGKMFDSSIPRGSPTSFGVKQVIKGWTEGLQLMKLGDTMRFWIPADLAYGDKPARPGTPSGPLVFDVQLLGINGTLAPSASASASAASPAIKAPAAAGGH